MQTTNNVEIPVDIVDLERAFAAMVDRIDSMKAASYNPGEQAGLYMYARYHQALGGDVTSARPGGLLHPFERKKWDARNEIKGMSSAMAMQQYIDYGKKL